MNQYHQTKVVVEGHTDDSGDALYNLTLSEQRANAVAELLIVKYGIDSARVTAKGLGESSPLVDASAENYRAINRRVVAVLNVVEDIKK
jgi:OOP family OmpA-OmpF porin